LTTLASGLAAACESDLKKIIALSTLSQLGVMMTSLGLGLRCSAFAHLVLHAFFKALLFMAVGVAIHSQYGSQESRCCFGLGYASPLTLSCIYVSLASLCGLCFMSGWVSKDNILECQIRNCSPLLCLILFYLGIGVTVQYSVRAVSHLTSARNSSVANTRLASASSFCSLPLILLFVLSILGGYLIRSLLPLTTHVLRPYDKLIVSFLVLLSGLFSIKFSHLQRRVTPSFSYLKYRTGATSYLQSGFRIVFSIERSPIGSLWTASAPGAILSLSSKRILFLRSVVLCSSVFLLYNF